MNWDLLDVLVFGTMVASLAAIVFVARRARSATYRVAVIIAAIGAFVLVWVNGAVGIIGNEENDANQLFFGVLAVAVLGSVFARLRARGMSIALYATAAAQVAIAVYAISMQLGASGPIWPRDILMLTAFFSAFWLVSGWLFSKAAAKERRLFAD